MGCGIVECQDPVTHQPDSCGGPSCPDTNSSLFLLMPWWLGSKSKHLGDVSYVLNLGIFRGIAHKRTIRPRCRRASFCLPVLAATKGTIGAQNALPNLI